MNILSLIIFTCFGSVEPQFDTKEEKKRKKKQHHGYMLRPGVTEKDMHFSTPSLSRMCCCCCRSPTTTMKKMKDDETESEESIAQRTMPYYFPKVKNEKK